MNKSPVPDMDIPKVTMNFVFDQIAMSIGNNQYSDLLDMFEYFQRYNKFEHFNDYRPTVSIQSDPLAYWKFARSFFSIPNLDSFHFFIHSYLFLFF